MTPRRQQQAALAERWYYRQLVRLARHIQSLARATAPEDADALAETLRRYSETLRPWASRIALRMVSEVDQRERNALRAEQPPVPPERQSTRMYSALQRELRERPSGLVFRQLQQEQVELIASLPLEVASRVQEIASGAAFAGMTQKQLIAEIQAVANTTQTRARLIARTEVARTFSTLTEARARSAGSTQYIWRARRDVAVREMHRELDGQVFSWDDPPVAERDGTRHHPGRFPNCRCTAEPLFPRSLRVT